MKDLQTTHDEQAGCPIHRSLTAMSGKAEIPHPNELANS
jgi:hypothetical protein